MMPARLVPGAPRGSGEIRRPATHLAFGSGPRFFCCCPFTIMGGLRKLILGFPTAWRPVAKIVVKTRDKILHRDVARCFNPQIADKRNVRDRSARRPSLSNCTRQSDARAAGCA